MPIFNFSLAILATRNQVIVRANTFAIMNILRVEDKQSYPYKEANPAPSCYTQRLYHRNPRRFFHVLSFSLLITSIQNIKAFLQLLFFFLE